jgi:hypothetical protein
MRDTRRLTTDRSSNMKITPVKGMMIGAGIGVVLIAAWMALEVSGTLDRIPAANNVPAAAVETPIPGPGTIPDGTWTIGADIQPGTYRIITAVTEDANCFWRISKTGTNGLDIVAGDIVKGGRPSVTLAAGQDFISHNCGTWAKQ